MFLKAKTIPSFDRDHIESKYIIENELSLFLNTQKGAKPKNYLKITFR